MKQVADSEMVKNALGADYDEMTEPPEIKVDRAHALWPEIRKGLADIFDPEIPVNIYELGLIYEVVMEDSDGITDVTVNMTLTSPGCPVAQDMPVWVQNAILPIDGVGEVLVNLVWDPTWDPSKMSETAKIELNMF